MTIRIIDGNNVCRRYFEKHGLSTIPTLTNQSFANPLETQIWVWDGKHSKKTRQKIYPEYKATRSKGSDEFYNSVNLLKEALTHTPTFSIEIPNFEADDVIAQLCKMNDGSQIIIESNDADFLQLENDCIKLNFTHQKLKTIPAKDMILYKVLVGDPSDNIKGLPSFGAKTFEKLSEQAKKHLMQWLTSEIDLNEALLLDSGFTPRLLELLLKNKKLLMDYYLIVNFIPVPVEVIKTGLTKGNPNRQALTKLFQKYMLG